MADREYYLNSLITDIDGIDKTLTTSQLLPNDDTYRPNLYQAYRYSDYKMKDPTAMPTEGTESAAYDTQEIESQARAEGLSFLEQTGNALAQFGAITASTVIGNIGGLIYGIGAGVYNVAGNVEGNTAENISHVWNNDVTRWAVGLADSAREKFPIERSNDYDDKNLWQRAGTSTFWLNLVANSGYTVGAQITNSAIQFALPGAGQILGPIIGSFGEATTEAMNAYNEKVNEESTIALDEYRRRMARATSNEEKMTLMRDYNATIEQIEHDAAKAGNMVHAANMAILSIDNAIVWSRLFRSSDAITKALNKELSKGITHTVAKQGTTSGLELGMESLGKAYARTVRRNIGESLMEGVQEVTQSDITNFADVYAGYNSFQKSEFNPEQRETFANFWDASYAALQTTFGDKNTQEEFASGVLMRLLGSPAVIESNTNGKRRPKVTWSGGVSEILGVKNEYNEKAKLVNEINTQLKNTNLDAWIDTAIKSGEAMHHAQEAAARGDTFTAKNAEETGVVHLLSNLAKVGKLGVVKDAIDVAAKIASDESEEGKALIAQIAHDNNPTSPKSDKETRADIERHAKNLKDDIKAFENSQRHYLNESRKYPNSTLAENVDILAADAVLRSNAVRRFNDLDNKVTAILSRLDPKVAAEYLQDSKMTAAEALAKVRATGKIIDLEDTNTIADASEDLVKLLDRIKGIDAEIEELSKTTPAVASTTPVPTTSPSASTPSTPTNPTSSTPTVDDSKIKSKRNSEDKKVPRRSKDREHIKGILNTPKTLSDFKSNLRELLMKGWDEDVMQDLIEEMASEGAPVAKDFIDYVNHTKALNEELSALGLSAEDLQDAADLLKDISDNSGSIADLESTTNGILNDQDRFVAAHEGTPNAEARFMAAQSNVLKAIANAKASAASRMTGSANPSTPGSNPSTPAAPASGPVSNPAPQSPVSAPAAPASSGTEGGKQSSVGKVFKRYRSRFKSRFKGKDRDYLEGKKAFQYIRETLKEGDELTFGIDTSLYDRIVVFHGDNIIDVIDINDPALTQYAGFSDFVARIQDEYTRSSNVTDVFKSSIKVKVAEKQRSGNNIKVTPGTEHDLGTLINHLKSKDPSYKPRFIIIDKDGNVVGNDDKVEIKGVTNIATNRGSMYMLVEDENDTQVPHRYIPQRVLVKRFAAGELNPNNPDLQSLSIIQDFKSKLDALITAAEDGDADQFNRAAGEFQSLFWEPDFFINKVGNSIQFEKRLKDDKGKYLMTVDEETGEEKHQTQVYSLNLGSKGTAFSADGSSQDMGTVTHNEAFNEALDELIKFKLLPQISISTIKDADSRNALLEKGMLSTDSSLELNGEDDVVFITEEINLGPESTGTAVTPSTPGGVAGGSSVVSGIKVTLEGDDYYVDLDNNIIRLPNGNEAIALDEDTEKALYKMAQDIQSPKPKATPTKAITKTSLETAINRYSGTVRAIKTVNYLLAIKTNLLGGNESTIKSIFSNFGIDASKYPLHNGALESRQVNNLLFEIGQYIVKTLDYTSAEEVYLNAAIYMHANNMHGGFYKCMDAIVNNILAVPGTRDTEYGYNMFNTLSKLFKIDTTGIDKNLSNKISAQMFADRVSQMLEWANIAVTGNERPASAPEMAPEAVPEAPIDVDSEFEITPESAPVGDVSNVSDVNNASVFTKAPTITATEVKTPSFTTDRVGVFNYSITSKLDNGSKKTVSYPIKAPLHYLGDVEGHPIFIAVMTDVNADVFGEHPLGTHSAFMVFENGRSIKYMESGADETISLEEFAGKAVRQGAEAMSSQEKGMIDTLSTTKGLFNNDAAPTSNPTPNVGKSVENPSSPKHGDTDTAKLFKRKSGRPPLAHKRATKTHEYVRGDVGSEVSWLKSVLPNIPVKVLSNIFSSSEETVHGMFTNMGILLSQDLEAGTSYHEAFHAVANKALTTEERARLFEVAKEKYGDYSENELEEMLAEDFRFYMMSRQKLAPSSKIRSFFSRMLDRIKEMLGMQSSITSLYHRISEGYYRDITMEDSFNTIGDSAVVWSDGDISTLPKLTSDTGSSIVKVNSTGNGFYVTSAPAGIPINRVDYTKVNATHVENMLRDLRDAIAKGIKFDFSGGKNIYYDAISGFTLIPTGTGTLDFNATQKQLQSVLNARQISSREQDSFNSSIPESTREYLNSRHVSIKDFKALPKELQDHLVKCQY